MALSTDPHNYDRKSSEMKPKLIGYFSGSGQEISEDISRLRYVNVTVGKVRWDLKPSHEITQMKSSNADQSPFFQYLQNNQQHLETGSDIMRATIVSGRSTISDIAHMPYTNVDKLEFCAHLINGVIYLYKATKHVDANVSFPYGRWSKKLQKYLTTGQANGVPDPNERVMESEEFVGVYKLNLKNHTIIYRGDIDGILLNKSESEVDVYSHLNRDEIIADINRRGVVDISTCLWKENCLFFRHHKSRHFWIYSTLGMAYDTIVGFRNNKGVVYKCQLYTLKDFEELGLDAWKKNIISNFVGDFMTFIKICLANALQGKNVLDTEKRLYFTREPKLPLIQGCHSDSCSYEWIPEWYLETIRQNIEKN